MLRVFPPAPGADGAKHGFTAISITIAVVTGAVTAPLFALQNRATGAIAGLFCALSAVLGLVLRLTRNSALGFWALQGLVTLMMVFCAWTELGPHTGWAMWLAILPLTGMLYGGRVPGLIGLGVAAAATFLIVLVPAPGLFKAQPVTSLSSLTRAQSFFVAAAAIGLLWHEMRLRALERAEAAGRARTMFLANMSHELRTPMNGVIGLTEVLRLSDPRPEQAETLEVMRRSGQQLLALINNIIDFARLDAGRMPLEQGPVDLARTVRDVIELVRPTIKAGGPTLELTLGPDLPAHVLGDEVRLRQILTNLVGNAVKFTPTGKVSVHVVRTSERLHVVVKDTGVGISPETQARLFRPFEQAEAGSNRRYAGSGLGLAIARELVGLMGGSIAMESAEGQGSTFTISLPLTMAVGPSVEAPLPGATAPASPGLAAPPARSVLVVDDNEVNLFVAVALLKKAGYRTATAKSGLEALAKVDAADFDLVLMDCQMPELDGYEATRRIRALPSARRETPIIALTASALREELDRCLEVGMNGCLSKPVTLGALTGALAKVFEEKPPR